MCLAIPGKIITIQKRLCENELTGEVESGYAFVNIMGVLHEVNVQLIDQPKVEDYVLVHAGCAIERIDMEYFEYLQTIFQLWLEEC